MLHQFLLPNKYKKWGWFLLIPSTIVGIILITNGIENLPLNTKVFAIYNDEIFGKSEFFSVIKTNITGTLVGSLFIIGGILIVFSKEKNEDEFIANLRQSSLLWAVLVNYILLLFSFVFIYGIAFMNIMLFNMFTVLIIFIVRFNYVLYRNSKFNSDEKYH
ncbi:MAG: hypothetical protein AMXMBFR79_04510 [Chitinophagaceae bacterium]